MAQEHKITFQGQTALKASDIKLSELNIKDPFRRGYCPYKNGQELGKFLGFRLADWEGTINGEKRTSTFLNVEFEGDIRISLSSFLKESEDAIADDGTFYHVENKDVGMANIMRKHSTLTDGLLGEIESYLKKGKHRFEITTFLTLTPWGKRQRNHLINII